MNASELFSIVSKVKRERWPKDVAWSTHLYKFYRIDGREGYVSHVFDDDHAELIFEAALARAGAFGVDELIDGAFRAFEVSGEYDGPAYVSPPMPSRVAALAAALVAMDGGGE